LSGQAAWAGIKFRINAIALQRMLANVSGLVGKWFINSESAAPAVHCKNIRCYFLRDFSKFSRKYHIALLPKLVMK
jgi:hypothetical protein